MQDVIVAAAFLVIYLVFTFVTDRAIDRYLSALANSKIALRVIGFTLAFVGIFFLMVWGHDPTIIALGQSFTLNPLRWIWWFLGAVTLGISQGFIVDAQYVGKLEAKKVRVEEPIGVKPSEEVL